LMLCNDTRFSDPIRFEWKFTVAGTEVKSGAEKFEVPPGERRGKS